MTLQKINLALDKRFPAALRKASRKLGLPMAIIIETAINMFLKLNIPVGQREKRGPKPRKGRRASQKEKSDT